MIIGGDTKQYQVLVDPAKLRDYGLTLKEVSNAVGEANVNASGGFMERPDLEYFVRARGRVNTLDDLANSVVAVRNTTPILVKNVATSASVPRSKEVMAASICTPTSLRLFRNNQNANDARSQ